MLLSLQLPAKRWQFLYVVFDCIEIQYSHLFSRLLLKPLLELCVRFIQMCCTSTAHCIHQLPTIIADNAGYDSSELVAQLRAAHYSGVKSQDVYLYLPMLS